MRPWMSKKTPALPDPATLAPPAPAVSVVGALVLQVNRTRLNHRRRMVDLDAEIAALTEERRQCLQNMTAMEAALIAIGEDPALTVEERTIVMEVFDERTAGIVAAVDFELTGGDDKKEPVTT